MALPVFVINRTCDRDRLARFAKSAETHLVTFSRISALDAHRADFPFAFYEDLIGKAFWGKPETKPGAVGCFLSHRRAWQAILDQGLPQALICEDDAIFYEGTDRIEGIAEGLVEPDIIFANDRLCDWAAAGAAPACSPLPDVITSLAGLGGPPAMPGLKPSPGADAYWLGSRGAARLLQLTADQGIAAGVDWALIWNGLGHAKWTEETFPELTQLSQILSPPETPLNAHVLSAPIAGQARDLPSTIRHQTTRPIPSLMTRDARTQAMDSLSTLAISGARLFFGGLKGPDPIMKAHQEGMLWDEPGIRALLHRFPEGGTFVDIGAHVGNHAVAIGRLGGAGKLILVEPHLAVRPLLQVNLAINGLAQISQLTPAKTALWSSETEGWLLIHERRPSETTAKPTLEGPKGDAISMPLTTGDALLGRQQIDAIKIDTAGGEIDVLKGCATVLATQKPLVLIDHGLNALDRILRVANGLDYACVTTVESGRQNRQSTLLVPRPDAGR